MKTLAFTDPHIREDAFDELEKIFREMLKQKADRLVIPGDYFDRKKPTTKEIIFGAKWAAKFKTRFKDVIILRGNHDNTEDVSNIDFLGYFGIKVLDTFVDPVDNVFFGHFFVEDSELNFQQHGDFASEYEQYALVVLGHQHCYQLIGGKIIHLGSCRWINFNELKDLHKYYLIIENGEHELHQIKSAVSMVEVTTVEELSTIPLLAKVRLKIGSYDQYKKEINEIAKWVDKFYVFKYKLDFSVEENDYKEIKEDIRKNEGLASCIESFLVSLEDKEVADLLRKQFISEGLY